MFTPFFFIHCLLYGITKYLKVSGVELPVFFKNYFTDLLLMPIILTLCLVGVRLIKRLPHFKLNLVMIFGMTTFYALFFEVYAPTISLNQTGDWLDVVMYFIGGVVFWFWQNNWQKT